jgi:hypothetical protein
MAVDSASQAIEFSGGQWNVQPIWAPANAVSCPAAGSCVAASSSGSAASYLNGNWSAPTAIDNGVPITKLSCRSATNCVATDQTNHALFYASPGAA